ncbi:MAG: energy-coupling factor transporter transmembrane protein EcfT [Clostridiales Family XIII bacterium]|jgi:hypothetical protein|nr:energy-coupling factor transporter transmembrane protein EcfT [Clostridiales Family XIII bacterium]
MDDYYCFRKIKNTALVMIALVAVHIALSLPLDYYWNALQARLSGIELTVSGVSHSGEASQGIVVYLMVFGVCAALAFLTSPRGTGLLRRLMLVIPLLVFMYSAYGEYEKITPISEKFKDLYGSLEYAVFIPYLALAVFTAVYIVLVLAIPALRLTQAFGWVTCIVAILSYLAAMLSVIYRHGMTILEGSFGESDFYIYLVVFGLDVVSYFFMLSVYMTYCTIKREERWDMIEAMAMEEGIYDDEFYVDAEVDYIGDDEPFEAAAFGGRRSAAGYLRDRVIPDIEDLKEHEMPWLDEYDAYRCGVGADAAGGGASGGNVEGGNVADVVTPAGDGVGRAVGAGAAGAGVKPAEDGRAADAGVGRAGAADVGRAVGAGAVAADVGGRAAGDGVGRAVGVKPAEDGRAAARVAGVVRPAGADAGRAADIGAAGAGVGRAAAKPSKGARAAAGVAKLIEEAEGAVLRAGAAKSAARSAPRAADAVRRTGAVAEGPAPIAAGSGVGEAVRPTPRTSGADAESARSARRTSVADAEATAARKPNAAAAKPAQRAAGSGVGEARKPDAADAKRAQRAEDAAVAAETPAASGRPVRSASGRVRNGSVNRRARPKANSKKRSRKR